MATNLDLNDRLIGEAKRLGRHRTKREAVNAALREYVMIQKRRGLVELVGTIDYWPQYDHKAARRARSR